MHSVQATMTVLCQCQNMPPCYHTPETLSYKNLSEMNSVKARLECWSYLFWQFFHPKLQLSLHLPGFKCFDSDKNMFSKGKLSMPKTFTLTDHCINLHWVLCKLFEVLRSLLQYVWHEPRSKQWPEGLCSAQCYCLLTHYSPLMLQHLNLSGLQMLILLSPAKC